MLLYRELDSINDDNELSLYRKRLIDRFGETPKEGEELMQVVTLRRLGKRLGCEKIYAKTRKDEHAVCGQSGKCILSKQRLCCRYKLCWNKSTQMRIQTGCADDACCCKISTVGDAVVILRKILEACN